MSVWADFSSFNIRVVDTDPMDGIVPTLSFRTVRSEVSGATSPINWQDNKSVTDWLSPLAVSHVAQGMEVSAEVNGAAMGADTAVVMSPVPQGSNNHFATFANLVRYGEMILSGPGRLEISMNYHYRGFSEKQHDGENTLAAGFAELSLSTAMDSPSGYLTRTDHANFVVRPDLAETGDGRLFVAAQSFGTDPTTFMLRTTLGSESGLTVAAVPEPETYATMLVGGLMVAFAVRRSRRHKAGQGV
nr:PEP-CTERM sorting domain-containing protein [Chitinivorax tropicus]